MQRDGKNIALPPHFFLLFRLLLLPWEGKLHSSLLHPPLIPLLEYVCLVPLFSLLHFFVNLLEKTSLPSSSSFCILFFFLLTSCFMCRNFILSPSLSYFLLFLSHASIVFLSFLFIFLLLLSLLSLLLYSLFPLSTILFCPILSSLFFSSS